MSPLRHEVVIGSVLTAADKPKYLCRWEVMCVCVCVCVCAWCVTTEKHCRGRHVSAALLAHHLVVHSALRKVRERRGIISRALTSLQRWREYSQRRWQRSAGKMMAGGRWELKKNILSAFPLSLTPMGTHWCLNALISFTEQPFLLMRGDRKQQNI